MKNPKHKYPHTKQLIKIAQEIGGLSYKDIAERSRLSVNSTAQVYKWAKGTAKANYAQMQSLIDEFGMHLKKQYEHVFFEHKPKLTQEKIDALPHRGVALDVGGGQKPLNDLNDEELGLVVDRDLDDLNISCPTESTDEVRSVLLALDHRNPRFEYFKVTGEKVFQHTLNHSFEYKKTTKRYALYRIQIIKKSEYLWHVITQKRATHLNPDTHKSKDLTLPLHSSAEASIWWSQCHTVTSTADLINFMDNYSTHFCFHTDCWIEARATLPYLIRSKLSELGYDLQDVVDMTDDSTEN